MKISKCAVSLYRVRQRPVQEHQRCTEDRVSSLGASLSSHVCSHSVPPPPLSDWLTDHRHVELLSPWMTYTQPLSGAADVGSYQLNTCWFRRSSRVRIKIQRATSQTCVLQGFRPTLEQLTCGTKYVVANLFFPPWLRQEDWKLQSWTASDCTW